MYFWTTIRKNRGGRFSASRGLHEDDITNILREHVVLDKDITEALQQLLQLTGLKKFVATLKDDKEREHFKRHLRRYVSIYMPDCPFEVTTTNRYTITEHEASITARRDIQPREEIKYLTGVQVAMTEEQEKTLELARKDFSLVISSRKKTRSLFLGPARFANHDCDANARLSTKGYDGMQIVAVKPIKEGDEITVSYGEDYFGEDNEECLCHSCENGQVNGWAPFKPVEEDSDEDEDEDDEEKNSSEMSDSPELQEESCSLHKKRKYESTQEDKPTDSTLISKRAKIEPIRKPGSPTQQLSPHSPRDATPKKPSALRQEVPITSIEDPITNIAPSSRDIRTQQRVGLLNIKFDDASSSRDTTPQSSTAAASPKSSQSTDATSVDEDHATPATDDHKIKVDPETIHTKPTLGVATVKEEITTVNTRWSGLFANDTSSELSELSEGQGFDDVLQQIVKRKRSKTPVGPRNTRSISRNAAQNRVGTPVPDHTLEEGWVANKRRLGDYMTSRSLLSSKDSKWVECQTCEDNFVQPDGHRGTRKECPRCERHSKLYGYAWPKTDKEGKHDKEERIMDPRQLHRFVDPEEEKTIKKDKPKRKFKEEIMERFSTPRSGRESSMSMEVESGRRRTRVRKTM